MQVMYMMIEKHTACKNVCHLNELTAHAHLQDTHSGHVLTGDFSTLSTSMWHNDVHRSKLTFG